MNAIEYEAARQIKLLESGNSLLADDSLGIPKAETRLFNPNTGILTLFLSFVARIGILLNDQNFVYNENTFVSLFLYHSPPSFFFSI